MRRPTEFARSGGSAMALPAGTRIVKGGRLLRLTLLPLTVSLFRPGGSASLRLARWMVAAQSCSMALPRPLVPIFWPAGEAWRLPPLRMTTWLLAGHAATARPQAVAVRSYRSMACSGSQLAVFARARFLPASLSST